MASFSMAAVLAAQPASGGHASVTRRLCTGGAADAPGQWTRAAGRRRLNSFNASGEDRLTCSIAPPAEQYVRASGCHVPPPLSAWKLLLSRSEKKKQRLHISIVGDSLAAALAGALVRLQKGRGLSRHEETVVPLDNAGMKSELTPGLGPRVSWYDLRTVPRSEMAVREWLRAQLFAGPGEPDAVHRVVIFSLGSWYNLRCTSPWHCNFMHEPAEHVLREWTASGCTRLPEAPALRPGTPRRVRQSMQGSPKKALLAEYEELTRRQQRHAADWERRLELIFDQSAPPELRYAQDLLRLAHVAETELAARNATQVLWVDQVPQHWGNGLGVYTFGVPNAYEGCSGAECIGGAFGSREGLSQECRPVSNASVADWRRRISTRIWSAAAPSAHVLHQYDVLSDRAADHAHRDCTHYCPGSAGWQEHVASILTAVAVRW